jgi:hypothetical protein
VTLEAWDLFTHATAALLAVAAVDLGIAFLMRASHDGLGGSDGD